ncbi:hypothetical protein [Yersinia massiliensis]|uniref:hypothetical protein n=1 Tax=Yersinia massiliensis TaxID=419257 RepID=UPI0011A3E106|nr:hypothetical protein [Yersinia massiliensis]MCB5308619.1 hypothetical protein [Yersinia massiliensis]
MHRLVTEGLVKIDDEMGYIDIEFIFAEDEERSITVRLMFCPPSLDPVAAVTMHSMLGDKVSSLLVSVVSFYNRQQEEREPTQIFAKPQGAIDLLLGELHYLYRTLVAFMLKIANNERIEVLYFVAENQALNTIYPRYVKQFAKENNLTYINDGACYAIRTQHYPY